LAQLRLDYDQFVERGAEVLAIGPEGAEAFQKYWQANDLPFIGLPDPEHRVLNLYGQEFKLLKMGRMPAQVIVDRQGRMRYAHYGTSMQDIPGNAEIVQALDELNEAKSGVRATAQKPSQG
jgi:peroxiredoxin Q/BCP